MKKIISIVTPCYNEEENIELLCNKVKEIFSKLKNYDYEHLIIDNCSRDKTPEILKKLAKNDKKIKVIFNARNFGHIKSPYYAYQQATGDAIISLAADFQDPPELIIEFLKKWEEGYKIVIGVKKGSEENFIFRNIRKFYYRMMNILSEIELEKDYNGFGLYDKEVMDIIKERYPDAAPYLRGIICDIGFERARVYYQHITRKRGITKNNFYILYDMAMLGVTNHSKIPLRIATFSGFILSIFSLFVAFLYLLYKVIFWNGFSLGLAPLIIGLFFFSSVNLFFLGILGEYIASIHTQIMNRPLVIEKERINFSNKKKTS